MTNIQPNHLDRHGTLEAYADAKMNLVRFQRSDGVVFLPQNDSNLAARVARAGAAQRVQLFRFESGFSDVLQVPGRHNQDNAAAAVAVARSFGVADDCIKEALFGFTGLPHRLEFVAQRQGVRYYNDSKSTTPASAGLAIQAFEAPVILLIGGRDKGMSFDTLVSLAVKRAKAVVCYGETGDALFAKMSDALAPDLSGDRIMHADSLDEAVYSAAHVAAPGDVVVLSPACTSYDMFANYEQRGEAFCQLVHTLPD